MIVPVTPPAPPVTNDDKANTVSGLTTAMEYKLDDAADYVRYEEVTFAALDFSGEHTLMVRYAAGGINPFGPDTTLVFTTNPPVLAPPANPVAIATSHDRISLSWSAVQGATRYEVERRLGEDGIFTVVVRTTTTSFLNTGLLTNRTYFYRIRAYAEITPAYAYSDFSAIVSATPRLSTPTGLKANKITATSAKLTWGGVSGATRYEVERKIGEGGTFALISTVSRSNIDVTGLTPGTTYYYRVRAYKLVNKVKEYSEYSNELKLTTPVRRLSAFGKLAQSFQNSMQLSSFEQRTSLTFATTLFAQNVVLLLKSLLGIKALR